MSQGRAKLPTMVKMRFIDLFAGIGGFRLAFEGQGFSCVFSSEWDSFAARTYQANFGEMPAGDIRQIAASHLPDFDLLLAGFPCQPFSIAGVSKKTALGRPHGFLDQTQGTLFFEIARILKERRPRAFLLENVKNLYRHDSGRTFALIESTLRSLGYYLKTEVLSSSPYVPQKRERIFIAGFRSQADCDSFAFPLPPPSRPVVSSILQKRVDQRYTLSDHLWQYLKEYRARHQAAGHGFGYGLVDLQGQTRTLSARYHKDGSEILIPVPGQNPRRLTPRECARLMGFPDSFEIVVSDTQAYRQFGNSVAVPVVAAIAGEIKKIYDRQKVPFLKPQKAGARRIAVRAQLA